MLIFIVGGNMEINDILLSADCKPLFDEVQTYVTRIMTGYVTTIKDLCEHKGLPESGKDIFDNVWGSIKITPEELCLVDSPLIQRLRRIKQLGFTNMVYCNADHSRFSHTVGVLEASSRMAKVIQDDKRLERNSDFNFINIVRIAAILHDSGHTFYSHVSEKYFPNNQNGPLYNVTHKALLSFQRETGAKGTKLHELISVMILYTHEVKELIFTVGQHFFKSLQKNRECIKIIYDYIACLIIGQPCDASILPYSSIINGPIDADKIDYLSRDSACTKVPIAVDVARLIQKLTVVDLEKKDYKRPPIWIMTGTDIDNTKLQFMALNYSARKSCWQLSIARSIMFESVYNHHKKLSAEIMFRYAYELFEQKLSRYESYTYGFAMSICDDFFSSEMVHFFFDNLSVPIQLSSNQYTIFDAILNRDLWKRVASFSLRTLQASSGIASENVAYSNFLDEVMLNYHSTEQQKFFENLKDEIATVAKLLGRDLNTDNAVFAFIESMPPTGEYNDIDEVLIEYGDGHYKRASEVFKGEPWMQGKENKQNEYFLITNVDNRDIVYIALEKVLFKKEEKFLLDIEAAYCSKLKENDIYKVKMELLFKHYYDDSLDLVPNDLVLSIIGSNKIQTIADKFRTFQGKDGSKVDIISLKQFFWQFLRVTTDKNELQTLYSGLISILQSSVYINREVFVNHAKELFKKIAEYKGNDKPLNLIRIGGSRDSSASWSYYFNDLPEKLNTIDIENALLLDNDCLVFFDDGAYSGSQIISIFQEYMDIAIEQRATNEHHVEPLSKENKEKLKGANIILAYLFFNEKSEEKILHELKQLGIDNVKILYVSSLKQKLFLQSGIFSDEVTNAFLNKTLADIGKSILVTSKKIDGNFKERWDEERACNSSLGYNDAQQMIVFERNIPTYSLTAFWAPNGKYKGFNWVALFRRTEKD